MHSLSHQAKVKSFTNYWKRMDGNLFLAFTFFFNYITESSEEIEDRSKPWAQVNAIQM